MVLCLQNHFKSLLKITESKWILERTETKDSLMSDTKESEIYLSEESGSFEIQYFVNSLEIHLRDILYFPFFHKVCIFGLYKLLQADSIIGIMQKH